MNHSQKKTLARKMMTKKDRKKSRYNFAQKGLMLSGLFATTAWGERRTAAWERVKRNVAKAKKRKELRMRRERTSKMGIGNAD